MWVGICYTSIMDVIYSRCREQVSWDEETEAESQFPIVDVAYKALRRIADERGLTSVKWTLRMTGYNETRFEDTKHED